MQLQLETNQHRDTFIRTQLGDDIYAAINVLTAWKTPTFWKPARGAGRQSVEAPSRSRRGVLH
jgi:hypothetical protein